MIPPTVNLETATLVTPEAISAVEHYQTFRADRCSRMSGPFADKVAQQHELLIRSGVVPAATRCALDLGCGLGSQSVALAGLGVSVVAIDANAQLLAELKEHAGDLPIRPVLHNLCELASCAAVPKQADVAVCVGDILPHLPATGCITTLFQQISGLLVPGADLSSASEICRRSGTGLIALSRSAAMTKES